MNSLRRASFMPGLLMAASSLFAGVLVAQPNTEWTQVNLAATDAHVIPAYQGFAAAADALHQQSTAFCRALDAEGFASVQAAFHITMDAWQGVQHVQFGPITYFNWNFRLQFWPDNNGTASRQLNALIAGKDSAGLTPDAFARQSVGVQGLQALELQLFEDDSLEALQSDPFRCEVLQAISANIDAIAGGVAERWSGEFRTTVENADERGFFESAEDATIDFLKALVESVRRLQEQKLDAVLGETLATARIRRAESWRSERSIRNLKINVDSLEHLFSGTEPPLSSVLQSADVELINAAFAELQGTLATQPDALSAALESEAGHAALLQVSQQFSNLYESMEAALKNTDLYLGFNSLDGD